jgi:hypothetical protein
VEKKRLTDRERNLKNKIQSQSERKYRNRISIKLSLVKVVLQRDIEIEGYIINRNCEKRKRKN